jgi:hypothetical protein
VTGPLEHWADWLDAWCANGDLHARLVREAEEAGRSLTAGQAWPGPGRNRLCDYYPAGFRRAGRRRARRPVRPPRPGRRPGRDAGSEPGRVLRCPAGRVRASYPGSRGVRRPVRLRRADRGPARPSLATFAHNSGTTPRRRPTSSRPGSPWRVCSAGSRSRWSLSSANVTASSRGSRPSG